MESLVFVANKIDFLQLYSESRVKTTDDSLRIGTLYNLMLCTRAWVKLAHLISTSA
jgi:hypothetical protein